MTKVGSTEESRSKTLDQILSRKVRGDISQFNLRMKEYLLCSSARIRLAVKYY